MVKPKKRCSKPACSAPFSDPSARRWGGVQGLRDNGTGGHLQPDRRLRHRTRVARLPISPCKRRPGLRASHRPGRRRDDDHQLAQFGSRVLYGHRRHAQSSALLSIRRHGGRQRDVTLGSRQDLLLGQQVMADTKETERIVRAGPGGRHLHRLLPGRQGHPLGHARPKKHEFEACHPILQPRPWATSTSRICKTDARLMPAVICRRTRNGTERPRAQLSGSLKQAREAVVSGLDRPRGLRALF